MSEKGGVIIYEILFHIRMSLNYLKREKKVPELLKERLRKHIEEVIEEIEKIKKDYY